MASVTDFGQPAPLPDSTPSAADFGAPQASDFGAPQSPNPISTPHTYDEPIYKASKQYGVDVNLLRAVGMQETGLGSSSVYNAKTGTSVTPGNAGHGLFQLDPSSGASKEELDKAAKDPQYAADKAAEMLSGLLKKYGGNQRKALAAYNAGNPDSKDGMQYADNVLKYYSNMDGVKLPADASDAHKALGPEIIDHTNKLASRMTQTARQGKDPFKSIAQDPAIKPVADWSKGISKAMLWLREHPVEGGFDILGAGQHGVGELFHELAQQGGASAVHELWDNSPQHKQVISDLQKAVFHPDATTNEQSTFGLGEFINRTVGHDVVPTHREIDDFVKSHIWGPLQGPTEGALKTAEDLLLQTVTDPLTYADGAGLLGKGLKGEFLAERAAAHGDAKEMVAQRLMDPLGQGAMFEQGARASAAVARAAFASLPEPAKKLFAPLMQLAQSAEELGGRAFGVRRDLDDAGFTRVGKKARIAVENAALTQHAKTMKDIKEISADGDRAADYYLELAKKAPPKSAAHHQAVAQQIADAITTPEEREGLLRYTANAVRDKQIADKTKELIEKNKGLFKGNLDVIDRLGTEENSNIQKILDLAKPVVEPVRELGRRAIMWNFVPHGLRNVGSNVFLAGGLPSIMHGLGAMVTGVTDDEVKRLSEIGAMPGYLQEELKTGPGPLGAITNASQKGLEHVELGWRAGLLRQLDKTLGPPKDALDEYLRGHMINNIVGDYRNQSAFIKTFQALGGPFVAFRLGIVPRTFLKALATRPGRINRLLEAQQDINENRDQHGKQVSTLELGGPVSDMMSMWSDPRKYFANSLGFINQQTKEPSVDQGMIERFLHAANGIASSYLPELGMMEQMGGIAAGTERPKQTPTLTEQLEDVILDLFGAYYKEKKTGKQEGKEYREIQRGGF